MESDAVVNEEAILHQEDIFLHQTVLKRALMVLERDTEHGGFASNMTDFFAAIGWTETNWTDWIDLLRERNTSVQHDQAARTQSMYIQRQLYRLHIQHKHPWIDLS